MALKLILNDLEDAGDAAHFYEEKDGRFFLQIDGIGDHPDMKTLKDKADKKERLLQEKIRDLKTAEQKLADMPEDFSQDEWDRMRAEDAGRTGDPNGDNTRKAMDAVRTQLDARHATEIKRLKTQISTLEETNKHLDGSLRTTIGSDNLTKALMAVGIKPALMKAATKMFEGDVVVAEEDGKWVARMKSEIGGDDIATFVTAWASTDEAKEFIAPPKGDDERGGARTMMGDNPFAVKEGVRPNLTKQQDLIQKNPERARQLAKLVGVPVSW